MCMKMKIHGSVVQDQGFPTGQRTDMVLQRIRVLHCQTSRAVREPHCPNSRNMELPVVTGPPVVGTPYHDVHEVPGTINLVLGIQMMPGQISSGTGKPSIVGQITLATTSQLHCRGGKKVGI